MGAACCTDDGDHFKLQFREISERQTGRNRACGKACCPGRNCDWEDCPQEVSLCRPQLPEAAAIAGRWNVSHEWLARQTHAIAQANVSAQQMQRLEMLLMDLFALHDLNGNGLMEMDELVVLNLRIAMLHRGKDIDVTAVRAQYEQLFREHLDPEGRPVPYTVFRTYMVAVLDAVDRDPKAQEMILEQFCAEATAGRAVYWMPSSWTADDQAFVEKELTSDAMSWRSAYPKQAVY